MSGVKLARQSSFLDKNFAGGFRDPTEAVLMTSLTVTNVPDLISDHEEADTRMIFHAAHASSNHKRIIVESPDTDVAVLMTYAYQYMQCEELWLKTGVRDKVCYVPVHMLSEKLGDRICAALPGFHAMTGCDSVSGLFNVGKKIAWKALLSAESSNSPSLREVHLLSVHD